MPDIARRAHREQIDATIKEALARAQTKVNEIDYFAATFGPGLAIALEVGLKKSQNLAEKHHKPFVPVNHMEAHLLSSFAKNSRGGPSKQPRPTLKDLPAIGLLVSGGHTEMILMKKFGDYEKLGQTLDDAAGEAFDKVAKMLELGYPGGPIISELAKKGEKSGRFELPIPMENSGDLNFSYSGLKTACLYKIRELKNSQAQQKKWIYDFCAEFEDSVVKSLVLKLEKAVEKYEPGSILLGGGVISNVTLRRKVRAAMRKKNLKVYQPYSPKLFTDNAAMIGICAHYMIREDRGVIEVTPKGLKKRIDRDPTVEIGY